MEKWRVIKKAILMGSRTISNKSMAISIHFPKRDIFLLARANWPSAQSIVYTINSKKVRVTEDENPIGIVANCTILYNPKIPPRSVIPLGESPSLRPRNAQIPAMG